MNRKGLTSFTWLLYLFKATEHKFSYVHFLDGTRFSENQGAFGLVFICIGIFDAIMGIFAADGRGIFDPACIVAISFGFVSFVAGLMLAIVAGTETTPHEKRP